MGNLIHTPDGVRDVFGRECDKKRYLEHRLAKLYHSFGYQSIETPSFEFFDVFAREVGTTPSKDLYKFFDREGNTLVLRPDITPSVARAVAMYFGEEEMPLRLCYNGSVFINHSELRGRLKETTQIGAEFINDDSPAADAEVLALVIQTMQTAGLSDFQVSIGHVGFFRALLEEAGLDAETTEKLRDLLAIQNRFGAIELIESLQLRKDLKEIFIQLPELFGDGAVLDRAYQMIKNREARAAIDRLKEIYTVLQSYGLESRVTFDLGMVTAYRYYTGIIFQAYTYGTGDAPIKGGRYNKLMSHFGKEAASVGFAADIDALLTVLDRQRVQLPVHDIKTMVLYPEQMESKAIRYAAAERARGLETACVRFQPGYVLDDYSAYGRRNQFGGIVYFRSETEVYAINLATGETEQLPENTLETVIGRQEGIR